MFSIILGVGWLVYYMYNKFYGLNQVFLEKRKKNQVIKNDLNCNIRTALCEYMYK